MQNDFDNEHEEEDVVDFVGVKKSAVLDPLDAEEEGAEIIHGDSAEFELGDNLSFEDEEDSESGFALYDSPEGEDDLSLSF